MSDPVRSVLTSAVANIGFLVIQVVLGFRLGGSGKPYRKGLLVTHVIVFLLLLAGWVATFWKLQGVAENKAFSALALEVAGLGLLVAMVVGVVMAFFRKTVSPKLVLAHKVAMFVVAVGMIGGVLFIALKM